MSSEPMPYGVNFVSEFNNNGDLLNQASNLIQVVLNGLEHSDRVAEFQVLMLAHQHLICLASIMRAEPYQWKPATEC